MSRPWARRALLPLLALLALLPGLTAALARGEPTLADLRRQLLEAHGPEALGRALDNLQARVGREDGFADVGAFGDWLGALPDGRSSEPRVQIRRGWAYVTARRGKDAVPLLEAGLKDDPSQGLVRAYLGEARRQAGDLTGALATLATAVKAGYDAPFVRQTAMASCLALRIEQPAREAQGLPAYAQAAAPYLEAVRDGSLHATLAQALLQDLAAYESPTNARGGQWARAAGEHLLEALLSGTAVDGAARLALEAARALTDLDRAQEGRTPRVDLLEAAYRLGRPADREGHDLPEVLPLLAEALLAEGRYETAHRLCRERLAISESPAARRVLLRLPPDVGD